MSVAPSAQLMPTVRGRACDTERQKASSVWPLSVRPLLSTMVAEIMIGKRTFFSANTPAMALSAALALSVSKMVSTRSTSLPPSMSPRTCSA